jgi:hypothetical protein
MENKLNSRAIFCWNFVLRINIILSSLKDWPVTCPFYRDVFACLYHSFYIQISWLCSHTFFMAPAVTMHVSHPCFMPVSFTIKPSAVHLFWIKVLLSRVLCDPLKFVSFPRDILFFGFAYIFTCFRFLILDFQYIFWWSKNMCLVTYWRCYLFAISWSGYNS